MNEVTDMISVQELADKRGWTCEICGHATVYLERHHCLIHRRKGHPEFDDERNIQLVCSGCHHTVANSFENRRAFWAKQLERYSDMREWYAGLNLKCRECFD